MIKEEFIRLPALTVSDDGRTMLYHFHSDGRMKYCKVPKSQLGRALAGERVDFEMEP